jgi:hypothetical protein
MVVVFGPHSNALTSILEAIELRTRQVFLKDRFPEPLNLPQCLRMVRLRFDVLHLVFRKLPFEFCFSSPVGILTSIVG